MVTPLIVNNDTNREIDIALLFNFANPSGTKYNSPITNEILATIDVIAIKLTPCNELAKK